MEHIFLTHWLQFFIGASVVMYLVDDFLEKRLIKDEREELIQLKAQSFVNKSILITVFILSLIYFIKPDLPGWLAVLSILVSSIYCEVLAKIYFRRIL